jgi:hypothetical protein
MQIPSVRIANWNLARAAGSVRPARLQHHMAKVQADIWILTETRDSMSPGAEYRRVAASAAQARGENDERWVSIWTRLPAAIARAAGDEKYSACAIITLSSGALLAVFGTVLPWRGSKWRGLPSANACAFDAALGVQSQDWRDLNSDSSLAGLCVAGDFNQDLSATHYYWSRAARRSLRAALENNDLVALTAGDADPVRDLSNNAAACIDHICLSSAIASGTGELHAWSPVIDGHRLSDHPGIQVDLFDC